VVVSLDLYEANRVNLLKKYDYPMRLLGRHEPIAVLIVSPSAVLAPDQYRERSGVTIAPVEGDRR
jgi:predicted GH43/DUF377 family glycosyl hydrolase